MSQQKPRHRASAQSGKRPTAARGGNGKKNTNWQPRREAKPGMIAIIAIIGVIAIVAAYFAQRSDLFADRSAAEAGAGEIRISEAVSENVSTLITEDGEAPDWIEIENAGAETVNLNKYTLFLDVRVNRMLVFPDMEIAPGERIIVYCTGENGRAGDGLRAPFKLSASGGETIVMMNAKGREIDSVQLPELKADEAYCRSADGEWAVTHTATPGDANIIDENGEAAASARITVQDGDLEITEVMSSNSLYFPDENGACHDYVEIHNKSGAAVNLSGWYLSDSPNKLKRWSFPDINLGADEYIAVHCSGENRVSGGHIHTDFKISSRGETIYLTRPDGRTVSMVEAPALETNQAYSLRDGKWTTAVSPTPGAANQDGAAAATAVVNSTGVYISEIMASPTDQEYDWIEIYNSTSGNVDISGWGLSDNASRPRKWQFPQGTVIQPGEYMGIFCSGLDTQKLGNYLNANFALSADGGYTVCLSTSDGAVIDSAYVPAQYAGVAYGRREAGGAFYYFEAGTPGTANNLQAYYGRAEAADYSVSGGLFHTGDNFEVTLSAPGGSRIYYTLDCSDPDESDRLYQGEAISVSATTIIRTRVYRDGYLPSFMNTASYLYDVENEDAVYVVSLVSDEYNLTDYNNGIMVMGPNATDTFPYGSMNEGANFWMDWEREAHVELFQPDGEEALSQECGIKLHGQYSRAAPVKAFKVIARTKYGSNRFEYPIFSQRDYGEYQSFLLRASGQDYKYTFMRDSLLTSLAKDTSVMYQESEVCVVYINGVYYSLMYLRERINTHSVCQFEGWEGMENDIDLIKANSRVMQGSNDTFAELLSWLKNNDPNTQEAYDRITSCIDLQNYLEYMAIEIFVGNGDTANVKRYRNARADGKWHWILFDLDWAFFVDTNSIARWLDPAGMGTNKNTDTTLFRACMQNDQIRDQFLTYFGQQLATTFSTENLVGMMEERYYKIDGLLPQYLAQAGISESKYKSALTDLVNYAKTRPTKILGYFDGVFHFSDEEKQRYFGDAVAKIQAAE